MSGEALARASAKNTAQPANPTARNLRGDRVARLPLESSTVTAATWKPRAMVRVRKWNMVIL
jgi:hypothetical protein